MTSIPIITLDLIFQGKPQSIASYLIKKGDAVILVEAGPGSTQTTLETALKVEGLAPHHVTHVLLTHIHLDHAGAAGWLSRFGAEIYVHPLGASHLLNPEKLIASATRIYGDKMEKLWGEFLPVAPSQLKIPKDAEEVEIAGLRILPLDTPGHADHHYSYAFEDVCFSGDVGGVRIPGFAYLRAPMPPPELHFSRWRESVARLRKMEFRYIAPTHFGMFEDVDWHLQTLDETLASMESWLENVMQKQPSIEQLRAEFTQWMEDESRAKNLSEDVVRAYSLSNPVGMSADGLMRYWKKIRSA